MSRFAVAIVILFLAAAILFFGLIPIWTSVSELRAEIKILIKTSDELQEIARVRDELTEQYNSIPQADLKKLSVMLPTGFASSQFLKDMETLGARNGMIIKNIDFVSKDQTQTAQLQLSGERVITPLEISMNVRGGYDSMRSLLRDLEKMLRIYDITDISFAVAGDEKKGASVQIVTDYAIKGTAYYIK